MANTFKVTFCFLGIALLISLFSFICSGASEQPGIYTNSGENLLLTVGKDISPGVINVDYIEGKGYLRIITDKESYNYSNLGSYMPIPKHMLLVIEDGEKIFVSKELILKLTAVSERD